MVIRSRLINGIIFLIIAVFLIILGIVFTVSIIFSFIGIPLIIIGILLIIISLISIVFGTAVDAVTLIKKPLHKSKTTSEVIEVQKVNGVYIKK